MAKKQYSEELSLFEKYIKGAENEDAKRPYLFPLFKKLYGDKMKTESSANGADIYINGLLLIESKTNYTQWLDGFYQALHYQRKYGLAYNTIMVIAKEFVGLWKLHKLPEYVTILSKTADPHTAPNAIGKENARKTVASVRKEIQTSAYYWLSPKDLEGDIFAGAKNLLTESFEILKILKNIESDRQQIGTHNFIQCIERMKSYFGTPIEAVHAFYTIIYFWDITSKVIVSESNDEIRVLGYNGNKFSENLMIHPHQIDDFKRFIESQYIFTNEGSGLTVDYYFSRFDEVLAAIDPEYVKQHGIFFTNNNLSKFALWFALQHFPGNINDNYIVFDPAGGSGNLVSSWRGKLKHKIVSELQPDLLRTIERRMQADPFHTETGFTIIPKTSDGIGLNFLDKSANEYFEILQHELKRKNISLDKPICFLLNPPYKNTDENQTARDETKSEYALHPSILEHTGEDAGKERYLAFLSQIMNMCKEQHAIHDELKPVVMIFTPTSWLIPRPTYKSFRQIWDNHFRFHSGFIITSNEFFKLQGKWPLAFTIWQYDESSKANQVKLYDLTGWGKQNLNKLPFDNFELHKEVDNELCEQLKREKIVDISFKRRPIRDLTTQKMYDFKRDPTKEEIKSNSIFGGLPIKDERRNNKKTYGVSDSEFVGFMDDTTPCRIKSDSLNRISKESNRIWFRLDTVFININSTKVFCGPSDNRSYCAYDIESAKATCSWFAVTKALNGNYPVWANQYDIWAPNILIENEAEWYLLCFAFVLAENRCVVTKYEKDNPVIGAPEVFVDNPLCPINQESFWHTTLQLYITNQKSISKDFIGNILIEQIKELYKYWNHNYCKGQFLFNCGLQNEPYFKYFNYPDFLTPYSGLIQIRKFAEQNIETELLNRFAEITKSTKAVKKCLYELLVVKFRYFD